MTNPDDTLPPLAADNGDPAAAMAALPPDPPAPPPPPPPPVVEPEFHQLEFTGTGAEYFRIWVVNLALTIVTFGIYSAWAKARRLQFFDRHTRLAGAGFDYHGEPYAILKGRVIGLILFGLYSAVGYVGFGYAITILVALGLVLPWLLARSLAFRMHNTSYRGIRFRFSGSTKSAYWVFLGLPLMMPITMFVIGPFWHHRLKRYQFSNASFGRTKFDFLAGPGDFYAAYVLATVGSFALMFAMVFLIFAFAMAGAAGAAAGGSPPDPGAGEVPGALLGLILVLYAIAILLFQSVTRARLHNAVWNTMRIGTHRFMCQMSWTGLFGLLLTNLLATVATLGLFRPFAQVRLARFYTNAVQLRAMGSLDTMQAAEGADISAVGEETAGLFDLDIGF